MIPRHPRGASSRPICKVYDLNSLEQVSRFDLVSPVTYHCEVAIKSGESVCHAPARSR